MNARTRRKRAILRDMRRGYTYDTLWDRYKLTDADDDRITAILSRAAMHLTILETARLIRMIAPPLYGRDA